MRGSTVSLMNRASGEEEVTTARVEAPEVVRTGTLVVGYVHPSLIGRRSCVTQDHHIRRLALLDGPLPVRADPSQGDHTDPGGIGNITGPLADHHGRTRPVGDVSEADPTVAVEDTVVLRRELLNLPLTGGGDILTWREVGR